MALILLLWYISLLVWDRLCNCAFATRRHLLRSNVGPRLPLPNFIFYQSQRIGVCQWQPSNLQSGIGDVTQLTGRRALENATGHENTLEDDKKSANEISHGEWLQRQRDEGTKKTLDLISTLRREYRSKDPSTRGRVLDSRAKWKCLIPKFFQHLHLPPIAVELLKQQWIKPPDKKWFLTVSKYFLPLTLVGTLVPKLSAPTISIASLLATGMMGSRDAPQEHGVRSPPSRKTVLATMVLTGFHGFVGGLLNTALSKKGFWRHILGDEGLQALCVTTQMWLAVLFYKTYSPAEEAGIPQNVGPHTDELMLSAENEDVLSTLGVFFPNNTMEEPPYDGEDIFKDAREITEDAENNSDWDLYSI
eukprot:GHVN01091556.1.p1 GENE.GHVN01091556.1~~GHVN01091556.1.p1  ORF type:complete len:362 (-),score=34.49 GHVN01091556.1:251-1336(-)